MYCNISNDQEKNPIEVCLVTKYFYPTFTGAGKRFRSYAQGLKERGIELQVFTLQGAGMSSHEFIDDISVQRVPVNVEPRHLSTALVRESIRHFRKSGEWPDVLHYLHRSARSVFYILYAKFKGIPCVFSVTMAPSEVKEKKYLIKNMLYQWWMYLPFDSIIASSTIVKKKLICMPGISSDRVDTIPNGVNGSRFQPAVSQLQRDNIRRQLGFSLDDKIVLFVGHVSPRKGVDLLVDAWPKIACKFPRAQLLLVGPRYGHKQSSMPTDLYDYSFVEKIAQVETYPDQFPRVIFTGEVSNVEAYMKASDVFVFPSKREGMGNVVAEAMAVGLPCILTPYDGLPDEFGKPGHEYLLVKPNSDALANKVIEVLENEKLKNEIGLAARKWTEEHLELDSSLDLYARFYKTLKDNNQRNIYV